MHVQSEHEAQDSATAVEVILRGTSAQDSTPHRPWQQQADGTNIPHDEDPGAAGPCSPPRDRPGTEHVPLRHRAR